MTAPIRMRETAPKQKIFWPTLTAVYVLDFLSKRWAEGNLLPLYTPHEIIGNIVRFTLAYNKDAAMGLSLGEYSRVGFTLLAIVVLIVLAVFYKKTPPSAAAAAAALALVAAGALGNLTDRILFSRGVVDFIDIGVGSTRFYTFNVADAGITCGAILLSLLSLRDKEQTELHAESTQAV
jgi:signal peptidase II